MYNADGTPRGATATGQPRGALYGAGATSELLSIHPGEIQGRQFAMVSTGAFPVDLEVSDASVDDYDALLLPGGTVNPDNLRLNRDAVNLVKTFVSTGKPIAAICHGSWTLLDAGATRGRRMTSWPSLQTDLRDARADWVDEEVVVDGQLITSRGPNDLPAFCAAIVEQLAQIRQPTAADERGNPARRCCSAKLPCRDESVLPHGSGGSVRLSLPPCTLGRVTIESSPQEGSRRG